MMTKTEKIVAWILAVIMVIAMLMTCIGVWTLDIGEVVVDPTPQPTIEPSPEPTVEPTLEPTPEPTVEPTPEPTPQPTQEPVVIPTPEEAWIDAAYLNGLLGRDDIKGGYDLTQGVDPEAWYPVEQMGWYAFKLSPIYRVTDDRWQWDGGAFTGGTVGIVEGEYNYVLVKGFIPNVEATAIFNCYGIVDNTIKTNVEPIVIKVAIRAMGTEIPTVDYNELIPGYSYPTN